MFNCISATVGCVVWTLTMFVFLVLPILYSNDTLTGFANATKTRRAAKAINFEEISRDI